VFTKLGESIYSVLDLIYEMVSKIVVKCCTHLFQDEVLAACLQGQGHLVHGPTSCTRLYAEKQKNSRGTPSLFYKSACPYFV
jgi:hypothetical protein